MHLSREEEAMLRGDYGEAVAEAMKLVVGVGEALGAERLVEISHAHASGISYNNIGLEGLEWIKRLALLGGRARVYASFNPAGTCLCAESPFNTPELVKRQAEIIKHLVSMGFDYTATCIPYEYRSPRRGESLAWGESSAVAVANSLYGARTNREGGPLALAAALVGRTYYWGLHIDENREPQVLVRVEASVDGVVEAGLLGYLLGKILGDRVAYIDTPKPLSKRQGIAGCAAAAATGSIAHCIYKGLSPEDRGAPRSVERISVDRKALLEAREEAETGSLGEANVFFTGCPHLSPREALEALEKALEKRDRLAAGRREVWIALPGRATMDRDLLLLSRKAARHGVRLLYGTCPVVARVREVVDVIATDSLKTAFYLSRKGVRVALASLEEYLAAL